MLEFQRSNLCAPVWFIKSKKIADNRGFFARTFSAEEFSDHGLPSAFTQNSISMNLKMNTIRGLHMQEGESKLVRCLSGAILDVVVDLTKPSFQPGSLPSFQWVSRILTRENCESVFIPEGCLHGFQTLMSDTVVEYKSTQDHDPRLETGFQWNDPAFGIKWMDAPKPILSERDQNHSGFADRWMKFCKSLVPNQIY